MKKWQTLAYSVVKKIFEAPFLLKKMEKSPFGALFDWRQERSGLVGLWGQLIVWKLESDGSMGGPGNDQKFWGGGVI